MAPQFYKKNVLIIILAVLLVVALIFIGYSFYSQSKTQRQTVLLQQGAQIGSTNTIVYLYSEAVKCNQVPVTVQNQTINLVAVECLQALARQQGQ